MSKVHKISQKTFLKNRKQLQDLYKLGKQFDKEKDPVKKAALEKEIIIRCNVMKGKLDLKEASEEEATAAIKNSEDVAQKEETTGSDEV